MLEKENSPLNNVFFLQIWIGTLIHKRMGSGIMGKISYFILYLILTIVLFFISDGIDTWFVNQAFSYFNTYLLLGMMYVFFISWRKKTG